MTKDSFIKHMSVLKTISNQYESFFEKLHDLKIDIGDNEYFYRAFNEAIRVIEEEVGGQKAVEEDVIGYYIFESDWGAKGENCITIKDKDGKDTDISLNNLSELYAYLTYLHYMED